MVVYDTNVFHTMQVYVIYCANELLMCCVYYNYPQPRCQGRNDVYNKTRKSNADEHMNKKFEKLKKSPYSIAGYSYRIIFMF
jgi:hypothetical protein